MQEEWRDIPGFEGLYEVSNFGNARSLICGGEIERRFRQIPRPIKPSLTSDGYLRFSLYDWYGKCHHISAGKVVMLAFIGPCPKGYEVDHEDEVKTNNNLSNLRYMTKTQNVRRKSNVLTQKQVDEVCSLVYHFTYRELGVMYNVWHANIYQHVKKRNKRYGSGLHR